MSEQVFLIGSIVLCLLGNGFFSGSEIAVISARKSRIEAMIAEGSRAARKLKHLREQIEHFLATVQIGVTVMGTLAGVLGGYLAKEYVETGVARSGLACWGVQAHGGDVMVGA